MKSISEIKKSLESLNFKVAFPEYQSKNCGARYSADSFKLASIDYDKVITFDELINYAI